MQQSPPNFTVRAMIKTSYEACDAIALGLLRVLAGDSGCAPGLHRRASSIRITRAFCGSLLSEVSDGSLRQDVAVASSGCLDVDRRADAGALTLLLQIRRPVSKNLMMVFEANRAHADTLVVDLGDMEQVFVEAIRCRAALHQGLPERRGRALQHAILV